MTRNLFLTIFCAAGALLAAGPEDAVKQAERDWATAVVKKDYATLQRVMAPDIAYTHSDGRLDTLESYIDSLKSGKQTYDAAEHQAIDVRMLGKDVALVRATLRMTAASGGADRRSGELQRTPRLQAEQGPVADGRPPVRPPGEVGHE